MSMLFDVDVNELARVLTLITTNRLERLERPQTAQAQAVQDARDVAFETPVSRAICAPVRFPPRCQSFSNFSILGQDRMDNLLRHHS
jgi:hypothetical protein